MRSIYFLIIQMVALLILHGCKKENSALPVPGPGMIYRDQGNLEITQMGAKGIDVDGDGKRDFSFEMIPLGDPVLKRTRKQFYIYSRQHTALLNDINDQSPMLVKGDHVLPAHPLHQWWEISAIVLAEKIFPEGGQPSWHGNFKNAVKGYVPVRMVRSGQYYYGWIEVSIDQENEKLVVHRSGISGEAAKTVRAGE